MCPTQTAGLRRGSEYNRMELESKTEYPLIFGRGFDEFLLTCATTATTTGLVVVVGAWGHGEFLLWDSYGERDIFIFTVVLYHHLWIV